MIEPTEGNDHDTQVPTRHMSAVPHDTHARFRADKARNYPTMPNDRLRAAREAMPSRTVPGVPMRRAELAEAVNAYLWEASNKRRRSSLDDHTIGRYERGEIRWPSEPYRRGLRAVLNVSTDDELGFWPTRRGNTTTAVVNPISAPTSPAVGYEDSINKRSENIATEAALGRSLEALRTGLSDAFTATILRDAGIDELEQLAMQIARATRFRSPKSIILDLESCLGEVKGIMVSCPSESISRRSVRVAAQMTGLMSLSLLKLDDKIGSRNWVRTARLFAAETNDQNLRSWVQAQDAYCRFYCSDLPVTVDAAQYAQNIESSNPGVGSALAAAIEARACAIMKQKHDAMRAMANAESYLDILADDATSSSAFGYNEAQFRFHQGNALTRLGAVSQALEVQDRALEIYPHEDFMDRALVLLDRADCLVADGEVSSAVELATKTLGRLEPAQAQGLIANRARETLLALPSNEIRRPRALELREAIMSLSSAEEEA